MAGSFTPEQRNWRWYPDNGETPSSPLQAENNAPTITNYNIVRLRVALWETGGVNGGLTDSLELQWSPDGSNWYSMGATADWNYANSSYVTNAAVLSSFLLSGVIDPGMFTEQAGNTYQLPKSDETEHDFSIQPQSGYISNGTYYFRIVLAGTPVSEVSNPVISITFSAGSVFNEEVALSANATAGAAVVKTADASVTITGAATQGSTTIGTMVASAALAAAAVFATPAGELTAQAVSGLSANATTATSETKTLDESASLSAAAALAWVDEVTTGTTYNEEVALSAVATISPSCDQKVIVDTGGTGDYLSLNAMQSGEAGDLVTAKEALLVECTASTGLADTASVTLTGWVTSATHDLTIQQASSDRHGGKWNETVYRLVRNGDIFTPNSADFYLTVDGLQFLVNSTASYNQALAAGTLWTGGLTYIRHCIFVGNISGAGVGQNYGTDIGWAASPRGLTVYIQNCIASGWSSDAGTSGGFYQGSSSGSVYYQNCTAIDCDNGFQGSTSTASNVTTNCFARGCSNGFAGAYGTASDYNSSDISGDAPNTGGSGNDNTVSPWYSGATADADIFVDAANGDYHIWADSIFAGVGTNLSAYFTDDIDDATRHNWDLGADEASDIRITLSAPATVTWLDEIAAGGNTYNEEASLSGAAAIAWTTDATLGGSVALISGAGVSLIGGLAMDEAASLSAIAQMLQQGGLVLDGGVSLTASALTALADLISLEEVLTLDAAAALQASGSLTMSEAVALAADAGFSAASIATLVDAISLSAATVAIWVDELIQAGVYNEEVSLAAGSTLITTAVLEASGVLELLVNAQQTTTSIMVAYEQTALTGEAGIEARGGADFDDAVSLAAGAALSAVVGLLVADSINLSVDVAMDAAAQLDVGALASMAAAAGLTLDEQLAAAVVVTLTADAGIDLSNIWDGTEELVLTAEAAATIEGVLSVIEAITLTGQVTMEQVLAIVGEIPPKARFIVQGVITRYVAKARTTGYIVPAKDVDYISEDN